MHTRLDKLHALLDADPTDAFVLYGIAQELAKTGTDEGRTRALDFYDRCLKADPAYHYAYYHKAVALIDLERTKDAEATLRAGLAAARKAKDQKASGELAALLDSIT